MKNLLCFVAILCVGQNALAHKAKAARSERVSKEKFLATLEEIRAENQKAGARIDCPSGFVPYASTCHYFAFPESYANWFQAQVACEAAGGRLGSLENTAENEYVKTTVTRLYSSTYLNPHNVWTGLHGLSADFRWVHSNDVTRFTDWKRGEPNNDSGEELCVEMNWNDNYKWNDEGCNEAMNFFCEYP